MNILILQNRVWRDAYSSKRIYRYFRSVRSKVTSVDPREFRIIEVNNEDEDNIFNKNGISEPDCIIPRNTTRLGLRIIKQFEIIGKYVLNSSSAIEKAKDKFSTLQYLSGLGLPVPRTFFVDKNFHFDAVAEEINFPVLMKPQSLHGGDGIVRCDNLDQLRSIWELVRNAMEGNVDLLIQEMVMNSIGRDIRIIVIGEKVLGAVLRESSTDDFRSNYSRGGTMTKFEVNPTIEKLALDSVRAVNLEFAGVDILFDQNNQYKVCELNSLPGFKGFEKTTGINVSKELYRFLKTQIN